MLAFLEHLQSDRRNTPRTRNARLTAVKSFMHFVEYRVPAALEQIKCVLAIPMQRTGRRVVDHLNAEECKALLDAPDPAMRLGIRDRTMLHLSLTGGLRVSELIGLRLDDVAFDSHYLNLQVRGKGRKQRLLTLWKSVAESVRAWLAIRGQAAVPELFLNARGQAMTRAGFEYVLRRCSTTASEACPSLQGKRLSPHVLRHYVPFRIMSCKGISCLFFLQNRALRAT